MMAEDYFVQPLYSVECKYNLNFLLIFVLRLSARLVLRPTTTALKWAFTRLHLPLKLRIIYVRPKLIYQLTKYIIHITEGKNNKLIFARLSSYCRVLKLKLHITKSNCLMVINRVCSSVYISPIQLCS